MPFEPLNSRLPDIAEAETRMIAVLEGGGWAAGLPPADYLFLEMFCNERGCDCRRVMFTVFSVATQQAEAVIAYGWESAAFYRKWLRGGPEEEIATLQGPVLNEGSPQGPHADALLELFIDVLLPQTDYIERVKRHYKQFRATVERPRHPALRRRRRPGG